MDETINYIDRNLWTIPRLFPRTPRALLGVILNLDDVEVPTWIIHTLLKEWCAGSEEVYKAMVEDNTPEDALLTLLQMSDTTLKTLIKIINIKK